jgi:hypothetical protein
MFESLLDGLACLGGPLPLVFGTCVIMPAVNMFHRRLRFPVLQMSCVLVLLMPGCKRTSAPPSRPENKVTTGRAPAISGAKEDLARVVMVQNRSVRKDGESSGGAPKKVVFTVLTDGTGGRVVADVATVTQQLHAFADGKMGAKKGATPAGRNEINQILREAYNQAAGGEGMRPFDALSAEEKGTLWDEIMKKMGEQRLKALKETDPKAYASVAAMLEIESHHSSAWMFGDTGEDHVLASVDELPKVTRDLRTLAFGVSLEGEHRMGPHHTIGKNIALVDLERRQIDFVLGDADEEYVPGGKRSSKPVWSDRLHWQLLQNTPRIFMGREFQLLLVDPAKHVHKPYRPGKEAIGELLPISPTECLVRLFIRAKETEADEGYRLAKLNMMSGKLTLLPEAFGSFRLESGVVSEDGSTILLERPSADASESHRRGEEYDVDGNPVQAVLVLDGELQERAVFFVRNRDLDFQLDPAGKWLYFGDGCTIHRRQLDNIGGREYLTLDQLAAKAQLIWATPRQDDECDSYASFFLTRATP